MSATANNLFTDAELAILLEPQKWRIVANGVIDDIPVIRDQHTARWFACNRHSHSYPEMVIGLSGTVSYGTREHLFKLGPGTILYFSAGDVHQMGYSPKSSRAEQLWIHLLGEQIIARRISIKDGAWDFPNDRIIVCREVEAGLDIDSYLNALRVTDAPAKLVRARLIGLIITLVTTIIARGYRDTVHGQHDIEQRKVIEAIQEHIHSTCGRGLKLDTLAHIAGFSKFHFLRLFRRHTGHTIHAYINLCRDRRVQELLKKEWTKKAIAADLGFSCLPSFSRWFNGQNRVQEK